MSEGRASEQRGFFSVIGRGGSYRNLLYLLLSLPLATVYFTAVVVGLSLGVGLMALALVGIPILIGLWYVIHAFMQLERALATSLVGVSAPPVEPLPIWPGELWKHFKNFMSHAPTWKGAAYLLLRFPVAIVVFTVAVTFVSVAAGMVFAPTYMWTSESVTWAGRTIDPFWWSFLLVPIGVVLVPLSLHIVNALATTCASWTVSSLTRQLAPGTTPRPERLAA